MNSTSRGDGNVPHKLIVLIQAHANVDLLNRLIDRLVHPDITIYVNVDRKSTMPVDRIDPRARLIRERVSVHWGEVSAVEATLQALREILAAEPAFDHLTFISGQDYPVRRPEEILARLAPHKGEQFLQHDPIVERTHFADRYGYFHHWHDSRMPPLAYKLLRGVMKRLGLRRRMVGGLAPFVGGCWFTLTRDCAAHLVERARDERLMRFMRSTRYCDEHFFPTLICNSPFAGRIVNDPLRFVEFEAGEAHPHLLTDAHFDRIVASDALFCRKIDPRGSASLMDRLDERLASAGKG
ncbi:beta-1,6-N-acetylglucosaminyltransferase [Mitsuaria sp. GD03876]|uniref:beta-1,6-N-acetylglucosaminyltransferase n=1 Tax=Mitsuaria sp. GD03876 TaxID=2975399 RepID=UPI00244B25AC|nr:beta-1,6-N-acetylglucosaminyltransferase [Mitsuaria sp. GD03876]MDH0863712.1 beta-1,6-N-acetylglucosaminyltransferase [Mitsuaria sp. GD03876]